MHLLCSYPCLVRLLLATKAGRGNVFKKIQGCTSQSARVDTVRMKSNVFWGASFYKLFRGTFGQVVVIFRQASCTSLSLGCRSSVLIEGHSSPPLISCIQIKTLCDWCYINREKTTKCHCFFFLLCSAL